MRKLIIGIGKFRDIPISIVFGLILFVGVIAAQTVHSNTLAWAAEAGATGYNVYKAPLSCAGSFTKLTITPTTALTFTDTGMVDGEVNCYYVTALNPVGESDPSGTLLLTTPSVTVAKAKLPPPVISGKGQ